MDLAKEFIDFSVASIKNERARTMDEFISKTYYYQGLIYEKKGLAKELIKPFFEAYRSATHRDDKETQATVLNYIIRSYISDNLYTEAANLISICPLPNNARYLYYEARVKAV